MPSGTSVNLTLPLSPVNSLAITGPSNSTRARTTGVLLLDCWTEMSISPVSDCAAAGKNAPSSRSRLTENTRSKRCISVVVAWGGCGVSEKELYGGYAPRRRTRFLGSLGYVGESCSLNPPERARLPIIEQRSAAQHHRRQKQDLGNGKRLVG